MYLLRSRHLHVSRAIVVQAVVSSFPQRPPGTEACGGHNQNLSQIPLSRGTIVKNIRPYIRGTPPCHPWQHHDHQTRNVHLRAFPFLRVCQQSRPSEQLCRTMSQADTTVPSSDRPPSRKTSAHNTVRNTASQSTDGSVKHLTTLVAFTHMRRRIFADFHTLHPDMAHSTPKEATTRNGNQRVEHRIAGGIIDRSIRSRCVEHHSCTLALR